MRCLRLLVPPKCIEMYKIMYTMYVTYVTMYVTMCILHLFLHILRFIKTRAGRVPNRRPVADASGVSQVTYRWSSAGCWRWTVRTLHSCGVDFQVINGPFMAGGVNFRCSRPRKKLWGDEMVFDKESEYEILLKVTKRLVYQVCFRLPKCVF